MSNIELVIKMPKEAYTRIQALVSVDYFEHDICGFSMRRIADGTPIPKGHGRLIDAKDVGEYLTLADVPTIMEADKAESEPQEKGEGDDLRRKVRNSHPTVERR